MNQEISKTTDPESTAEVLFTRRGRRERKGDLVEKLRRIRKYKARRERGRQLEKEQILLVNREEDVKNMMMELRGLE